MRKLLLPLALVSCTVPKAKTLHLGDVVQFKFAGRNLFYAEACQNSGVVRDQSIYSDSARYMIQIECILDNNQFKELVWIDEEDIVKVLRGPSPLRP